MFYSKDHHAICRDLHIPLVNFATDLVVVELAVHVLILHLALEADLSAQEDVWLGP